MLPQSATHMGPDPWAGQLGGPDHPALLTIKPREIINLWNEQFRLLELPVCEGRHGAHMAECPLRDVVIIDVDITLERLRQVLARAAAAGRQDLADAPVAALHHAVGLRMARRDEAVLKVLIRSKACWPVGIVDPENRTAV